MARGYRDPVPHRHKYDRTFLLTLGKNANIPLYSARKTSQGEVRRFTYVESRYFYCQQYELLAPQTKDFQELQNRLQLGTNLQIVGYDGYPITQADGEPLAKSLYKHYLDTSRPFGHELVLYTLLTLQNPEDYPWNRYRKNHPELYVGFLTD